MKTINNKQVFNYITVKSYRKVLLGVLLLSFALVQGTLVTGQNDSDRVQTDSTHIAKNIAFSNLIDDAEYAWKINDVKTAELHTKSAYIMLGKYPIHDSNYARLLHTYGKLLIDRQVNGSGIDSLLKSITLKIELYGDYSISLAKTYNYIGIGYFQMRDNRNANKFYRLSVNILLRNKIWDPNLFDSYLNLGIVEAVQGKYDRAYFYFDTTRMVLDSIGSQIDSLFIARFYSNYGLLATLNGKLDEGNKYFNIAELIFKNLYGSKYLRISDINVNKGLNAYYNFEFDKSKLFYKKAIEIYQFNESFQDRIPRTYSNLAAVSLKLGQYEQAIQYSEKGLGFSSSEELKWMLYSSLCQAYIALGNDELASENFYNAINLKESKNISSLKKFNLNIAFADFLLDRNKFEESKKYYDEAQRLIKISFGNDSDAYANILTKLGNYYLAIASTDSSLHYFNKAINLWSINLNSDRVILTTFNETKYAETFIGRARAYFDKYLETENAEYLGSANQDIQNILSRMEVVISKLDKESKLLLSDQLKPAYKLATDIAFEHYKITNSETYLQDIFNYMEQSKSAVLLATVRNYDALKSTDVPNDVAQLDRQLSDEINGIRQLLADEKQKVTPAPDKISFFESKLLSLLLEQDSLIIELELNYPKYYALKYDRSTLQLNSLIEKLDQDEVIVEYMLSDSIIYSLAIANEGIKLQKIEIDSSFWKSLEYLLTVKNVNIAEFRKSETEHFYRHSNFLYRKLIEPVYSHIQSKKLVIIPDGVLGYLPFEILSGSNDEPEEVAFKSIPYLITECPVSYSYSATLKYNPYFIKRVENNKELLAFAPQYKEEYVSSVQSRQDGFENLPHARQEVISIEEMWNGNLLLDNKATRSNFIKKAGEYDIIHLAMHTLINDSVPMFSKLVFANEEGDTTAGYLNTYEIYDLNLNASMVTLSACNTGTGIYRSGEGIMSLARGFIYAGAPSIVMSLWEVQDESGAKIMKRYYKNLKLGHSKDVALQKAKLEFLQASPDYSTHPFYWSAFIVTGDTQALVTNKQPMVYSTLVAFGIFCCVLIGWLIVRYKKRSGKTV